MIYAERGNRVIAIREDSIQKYVEQGYMITDEFGNVIKNTIPVDVPNLKKAYVEHIKEIEALKAENSQLKAQIAELTSKTATKKAEKPVEVVAETAEVEEAPKETKKSTAKKSTNK